MKTRIIINTKADIGKFDLLKPVFKDYVEYLDWVVNSEDSEYRDNPCWFPESNKGMPGSTIHPYMDIKEVGYDEIMTCYDEKEAFILVRLIENDFFFRIKNTLGGWSVIDTVNDGEFHYFVLRRNNTWRQ